MNEGGGKMKRFLAMLLIGLFGAGLAFAGASKDEAKSMVEEGVAFLNANGKEKALTEINNPKGKFVKGELYIFVYDFNANVLAQPMNPKLVGKCLLEVPDSEGKLFRKEIVEMAKVKGEGWVDYKYKNPANNKTESKTTYFKKAGDVILGCGVYK
jgi:cytochrome c